MLEIFDQNPQSRVFHVDDECYVVYLGSHWEDYHPFLRLGTSANLPSDLPKIISTIVVPDALTGNPLDEAACLTGDATEETHYVGDQDTVQVFKEFVGKEGMPVEAIQETDHEDDDTRHVLVYYYKDGNLRIKFRKNEILDLKRRESVDSHFVARAQSAKNDYGKAPFKALGSIYQENGFVVRNGTPYLCAKGELAALTLAPDYFFDLCTAGIDPDRVRVAHVGEPDRTLVNLFKRARGREAVRVVTTHKDGVSRIANLFRENTLPELDLKLADGGGSFTFHGYDVSLAPGRIEARLQGVAHPIIFGAGGKKTPDAIAVDEAQRTITLSGGSFRAPLLDGALYHIVQSLPTRTAIENDYLPEKNYPYRDLISEAENTLLSQLQYYFNEVFAGRDPGKVLRTMKQLDPVRHAGRSGEEIHPVVQILVHNYAEFARYIKQNEPAAAKAVEPLVSVLERLPISARQIPVWLPITGKLVLTQEQSYLFFSFAARITRDRYVHAPAVAERVATAPLHDFKAERSRLADLIAGLATPEQMDEAKIRRIAEATKKPTKKPAPVQEPVKEEASEQNRAASSGGTRRRRTGRWILPAGVAAGVLLLLFLLFLTNVIPNPWFGSDPIVAEERADDSGASDAGDGRDAADGTASAESGSQERFAEDGAADSGIAENDDIAATGPDGEDDQAVGADTDDPTLPEGWPEEALPALRALDQLPDVTITDDGVTGPGGIEITIFDIIRLVNQIATGNGFDPMGEAEVQERDPDWIFPGGVFDLPNGTSYTVVRGDTLWDITVRYMVARLRQDYQAFVRLTAEHEEEATSSARKSEIVAELRRIAADSHTENFVVLVNETVDEWDT